MSQKLKLYGYYKNINSSNKENVWQLVGSNDYKSAGVFRKIKDFGNTGHTGYIRGYWYDEEGNDIYCTRNPNEEYYYFVIENVIKILFSNLEDKVENILKMIEDYENNK